MYFHKCAHNFGTWAQSKCNSRIETSLRKYGLEVELEGTLWNFISHQLYAFNLFNRDEYSDDNTKLSYGFRGCPPTIAHSSIYCILVAIHSTKQEKRKGLKKEGRNIEEVAGNTKEKHKSISSAVLFSLYTSHQTWYSGIGNSVGSALFFLFSFFSSQLYPTLIVQNFTIVSYSLDSGGC